MELKEPTPCCGATVLEWQRAVKKDSHGHWQCFFVCKCGQFKVNENGRVLGKRYNPFNSFPRRDTSPLKRS